MVVAVQFADGHSVCVLQRLNNTWEDSYRCMLPSHVSFCLIKFGVTFHSPIPSMLLTFSSQCVTGRLGHFFSLVLFSEGNCLQFFFLMRRLSQILNSTALSAFFLPSCLVLRHWLWLRMIISVLLQFACPSCCARFTSYCDDFLASETINLCVDWRAKPLQHPSSNQQKK